MGGDNCGLDGAAGMAGSGSTPDLSTRLRCEETGVKVVGLNVRKIPSWDSVHHWLSASGVQWSKFVKHGRPGQKLWLNIAADSGVRATVSVRKRSGPVSIVGTCDTSTIKTVKTKLLSVFGTRFSPDLDAETLSV